MIAVVESWRQRGEAARLAHEAVNRAFREHVREREPDRYAALLADFRAKTAAALPSTDGAFMPGLAGGHVRFVEAAIAFLEADPWFFRSGYEKQNIIRHLKRAQLSAAQRERLARVVLAAIDGHDVPTGWSSANSGALLAASGRIFWTRKSPSAWRATTPASAAAPPGSPKPPSLPGGVNAFPSNPTTHVARIAYRVLSELIGEIYQVLPLKL